MFSGIGIWEILIILFVTLLVVGPDKIPDVARTIGKALREARRASNYFRDVLTLEAEEPTYGREQRGTLRDHGVRAEPRPGSFGRPIDQEEASIDAPGRPRLRPILIEARRQRSETTSVALAPAGQSSAGLSVALSPRAAVTG